MERRDDRPTCNLNPAGSNAIKKSKWSHLLGTTELRWSEMKAWRLIMPGQSLYLYECKKLFQTVMTSVTVSHKRSLEFNLMHRKKLLLEVDLKY